MILCKTYAFCGDLAEINFKYYGWYDFTRYTQCIELVTYNDLIIQFEKNTRYTPVAHILAESRM